MPLSREERWEQKRQSFFQQSSFGRSPAPQLPESLGAAFAVSYDAVAETLRSDLHGAASQTSLLARQPAAAALPPFAPPPAAAAAARQQPGASSELQQRQLLLQQQHAQ
jgi:hypothetical protein